MLGKYLKSKFEYAISIAFPRLRGGNDLKIYQVRSDVDKQLIKLVEGRIINIAAYSEYIENKSSEPILGFASKIIADSSSDLLKLLRAYNDFIELNMGSRELNLSLVDVMPIVQREVESYQVFANEWKLTLSLSQDSDVKGIRIRTDFELFCKMLKIIISSMIEVAPLNTALHMHATCDVGLKKFDLSIFEYYASGDYEDRKDLEIFWGSNALDLPLNREFGIELMLAKKILKILNGRATYQCYEGEGVSFRVVLPFNF